MQDILLDSRQQLKESLMLDLARDDHGNQHLMIEPEQLLNDIDLGMDKNILQQNHIIWIGVMDSSVELTDLNDIDLTFIIINFWESVDFADESFTPKQIIHILFFYEQCLQDGNIALFHNNIDPAWIW